MTRKLNEIIDKLYEIFGKYSSGPTMEGSPLYEDLNKWNEGIFSKPLRELTEDDLSRYTGKAISTWGNSNDFKYFLPRIFELTAELKTPYEIWIAFDKLEMSDWRNWKQAEQRIVEQYMIALWESLLDDESENAKSQFQDYFSAIANFYPHFSDLLGVWDNSKSNASAVHLSDFIVDNQVTLFNGNKISGFYDKSKNATELIHWLLSDKKVKLLQDKFFELKNEDFAENISRAEQIIINEIKIRIGNK